MYKPNSYVVHPIYGVCKVIAVNDNKISGKNIACYELECAMENIVVKEPVATAKQRGIRKIISKNDAIEFLKMVQKKPRDIENNWKIRCQENTDKLKTGDIADTIEVAKSLFIRNRVKELSASEKRLYEKAYLFIVDELAISFKKDKEEVEDMISTALEKCAKKFNPEDYEKKSETVSKKKQ